MTLSLEELWEEIAPTGAAPTFRRVDDTHPLDLYIGRDSSGDRVLLLLTDEEPPAEVGHPRGLDIERGKRLDGRWALTVRLRIPEFGRLFSHLCEDLVEASRSGCRPEAAGRFMVERIGRWERLLSRGGCTGLDERSFRGLLAELVVLYRFILPSVGVSEGVTAWLGPLEADQDFRLDDRLVEVKSTSAGSLTVTVSSAEQLDVHDAFLFLAAVPIGIRDAVQGSDGTLRDLIAQIREAARTDAAALDLFDERLALTPYVPNDEWAQKPFTIGATRFFRVEKTFPRIVRSSIPAAVRSVRYELDLGLCREFEVPGISG